MRAVGFNAGQYGDLVACLAACQSFKSIYPDSHLTFGVGNRYADCAKLFEDQDLIDNVHIWDSYNDWPNNNDLYFMNNKKFDKVFHAMPSHIEHDWFNKRTLPEEMCHMHGLPIPSNLNISLKINKHINISNNYKGHIAVALSSSDQNKNISPYKQESLVNELLKIAPVVQLGAIDEPKINGAIKCPLTYIESISAMLSSSLLISLDTGMAWFSAAYKHATVGLYTPVKSFIGCNNPKTFQPPNENAIYLESDCAENIDNKTILESVIKIYDRKFS
jgi:ADP-heptose:LPS heptosyltransferase